MFKVGDIIRHKDDHNKIRKIISINHNDYLVCSVPGEYKFMLSFWFVASNYIKEKGYVRNSA
jgi:hypothetical protein